MAAENDLHNSQRRIRQKSNLQNIDSDEYDFTDDVYAKNTRTRKNKTKRTRWRNPVQNHFADDEEDDNKNGELLPKWKLALVVGVIGICFALLFPTVFNPLLNVLLGRGSGGETMSSKNPPMAGRSPPPSRSGPSLHPPAAAQMRMPPPHGELKGTTGGGRGGMFTWMMPFYTIGVVGFLGFTLYKIMFKQKKKRKGRHYNEDSDDYDSDTVAGELGQRKLRVVQRRLQKTEEAMRQILEQLENIAQATDLNANVPTDLAASTDPNDLVVDCDESLKENNAANIRLNNTQVLEVEKGLRELRELSDLYKKQQEEINDVHSNYEEDDDDQDNASQSIATESDEDDEKMLDYSQFSLADIGKKGHQHEFFENDTSTNFENIADKPEKCSNSEIKNTKESDNGKMNEKLVDSAVTKPGKIDAVNDNINEDEHQKQSKKQSKANVRRRLRKQ